MTLNKICILPAICSNSNSSSIHLIQSHFILSHAVCLFSVRSNMLVFKSSFCPISNDYLGYCPGGINNPIVVEIIYKLCVVVTSCIPAYDLQCNLETSVSN